MQYHPKTYTELHRIMLDSTSLISPLTTWHSPARFPGPAAQRPVRVSTSCRSQDPHVEDWNLHILSPAGCNTTVSLKGTMLLRRGASVHSTLELNTAM